jgi:hypothetical protein
MGISPIEAPRAINPKASINPVGTMTKIQPQAGISPVETPTKIQPQYTAPMLKTTPIGNTNYVKKLPTMANRIKRIFR